MEVVRKHERNEDVAGRAEAIPQATYDPGFGRLYVEQTRRLEAGSSCHQRHDVPKAQENVQARGYPC